VKTVSIWGVSTPTVTAPQPAGKIVVNTRHPGVARPRRHGRHG
jgi:hypothetical protein